jgi:hypothetical protein
MEVRNKTGLLLGWLNVPDVNLDFGGKYVIPADHNPELGQLEFEVGKYTPVYNVIEAHFALNSGDMSLTVLRRINGFTEAPTAKHSH